MDDPSLAWPAWKFGMKRGDLLTKLQDQYNTYPCPIQDADAFHHDIFEISHEANSTAEFHRLANNRRQQRLHELNDALESSSFEIIGNPSLIGTPQWQHAIQLFRTNSLDSLVRYFASYLPTDHNWHPLCCASAPVTSNTEPASNSPDKEGDHIKPNDPSGSNWQPLPSSSLHVPGLSGVLTADLPMKGNRPMDTTAPAVLSSSLGQMPKCTRTQEANREEIATPDDNASTMSYSNTFMAGEYRNGTAYIEGVCPDTGLRAPSRVKRVKLQNSHVKTQEGHLFDCRGLAQPIALTTFAAATLVPGPSRTTIALARSFQPTKEATAGIKQKYS